MRLVGLSSVTAWLYRPLASFHLLLAVFGLLTVFGLVMVLSASSVDSFSVDGSTYSVFDQQLVYVGIGLVAFYLALRMPVRMIRRFSLIALALCVMLLVLVLTPLGREVNGARSWLFGFEPVEFAKVAFALWGAHVLVTKRGLLRQYRHLLVPVVPVALLMFTLVMMQPALGSTITLFLILAALLWFGGAPIRLFGVMILGGLTGVAVLSVVAQYRLARVLSFLNPNADPLGAGMQGREARFALADGGWLGRGLGQGEAKWQYLQNVHNDFIFAVIGEELGFVGCLVVLVLFATTAYVGIRIASRNTDPWIRLVAASLTTWLVGQAAINIGYVVGLLPITGLPLPLISSGGSSAVTSMVVFGLLANFARHEPEAIAALRSLGPGRIGKILRLRTPAPYRPPVKRRVAGSARPMAESAARSSRPGAKTGAQAHRRGAVAARNGRGHRTPGKPAPRSQLRGGHP